MDTSPDAPGAGVEPIVHRGYDGGVIELPRGGTKLDPVTMPELTAKHGHTIVTSSGDTLLGADDKAGVAEIVAAVAHLADHPEIPHPTLRVGFTPDEEIGEGATLFDIQGFGAACAYTLDGSEVGELQDETFSADEIIVTVRGVEVHPGQATGKLVNALRLAAQIVAELPSEGMTPETTSGRQGFIHPYELTGRTGRASTITRRCRSCSTGGGRCTIRGSWTRSARSCSRRRSPSPPGRLSSRRRQRHHSRRTRGSPRNCRPSSTSGSRGARRLTRIGHARDCATVSSRSFRP
jgi:di/tripeptidase